MKKFIAIVLVIILMVSVFGCANAAEESKTEISKTETSKTETSKTETSKAESSKEDKVVEFSYPVPANSDGSKPTLTINMAAFVREDLPEYTMINGKSYYYFDSLEEATGIHLDMIGSASNALTTTEAVNLLIVSGDYPDVWRVNWVTHPGGPTSVLEDEIVLNLSDNIEFIPNLDTYCQEHPDMRKCIVDDNGDYYCFPYMKACDGEGDSGLGTHFRTDWLADAGLDLPETVDEWTEALRAFKAMGKGGLSFEARWLWEQHAAANISNAFNTVYDFYLNDGTVQYGPLDEGYGEFISLLASWYAEGLLDPDFATVDKSTVKAKWANHEFGAVLLHSGDAENGIKANKSSNTPFECDTVSPMVMKKGDRAEFGQYNYKFTGAQMSSVSPGDNQELAMHWCDYLYSEEGRKLTAFGIEGITWIADENGNWKEFTDLVMKNDADSPYNILKKFANPINWGYPQMKEVYDYFNSEYVNKANADYSNTNMGAHCYPPVTHSPEETEVISTVYNEIAVFVKEGVMKFILGTTPMSEWDAFVQQIKDFGIDEVLEVKQAAYDRYMAR